MKSYKKEDTKINVVVADYLEENNIEVGFCKYDKNRIIKYGAELWGGNTNKLNDAYMDYNHTKITLISNEKGDDGTVVEKHRNVKVQSGTGFKLNSGDWKSVLNSISYSNIVDTSLDLYKSIQSKYKKEELQTLTETDKFIKLFCDKTVGDIDLNQRKMKVLLQSFINKSLGNKDEYSFVMVSGEGCGKTNLLRDYMFKLFADNDLYTKLKLTDNEWVTDDYLPKCMIAEIDEKGVGINNHNLFKNLVSTTQVEIKDKGDNTPKKKISRALIALTLNDPEFIYGDDAINRRYLVFNFGLNKLWSHDGKNYHSIFKDVNFEKMWAEQYQIYTDDVAYKVDDVEIGEDNQQYRVKLNFGNKNNSILNILKTDILDDSATKKWVTSKDIKLIFQHIYGDSINMKPSDLTEIFQLLSKVSSSDKKKRFSDLVDETVSFQFSDNSIWNNTRTMRFEIGINENIVEQMKSLNIKDGIDISIPTNLFK
tara:strand:- start:1127 stop:2569 length:1443 start_codon:yes stop_codon:yes gene_type:complete